jgi:hypothetical protein
MCLGANKQKYHLFSFFFYKIREKEGGTGPAQGFGGGWYQREGKGGKERG